MSFQKPELKYLNSYPSAAKMQSQRSLLIFDQILLRKASSRKWIESFPFRYGVQSGEKLKDLQSFAKHMQAILDKVDTVPERPMRVIALGGGSVGDFAGFVASVLKRGQELVQVPSTWLAAIDSAHGGKNALNIGSIKNQIGTFHFPSEVVLIRELLFTQPEERVQDALGEALKISLIQGGALWKKWNDLRQWQASTLWKMLPDLIEAKYKVVRKDPLEKKGHRHILNFGHTVGHVLEAELKMSHGLAVLAGLKFAIQWSRQLGLFKSAKTEAQFSFLPVPKAELRRLKNPGKYLKQDKKRVGKSQIRFVFLQAPGQVIIRPVAVEDILAEIKRQMK